MPSKLYRVVKKVESKGGKSGKQREGKEKKRAETLTISAATAELWLCAVDNVGLVKLRHAKGLRLYTTKCSMCINIMSDRRNTPKLRTVVSRCVVVGNLRCLEDTAEDRTPPGPGAVRDDVGRVGDEWSVVCVELARLVTGTVVVRVTDR